MFFYAITVSLRYWSLCGQGMKAANFYSVILTHKVQSRSVHINFVATALRDMQL